MGEGGVGGNGNVDRKPKEVLELPVMATQTASPWTYVPPEVRRAVASKGGRARWSRKARARSKQLRQLMQTAAKAYAEHAQDLAHSRSSQAPELARHARRLLAAFMNLWELDGHDLPPGYQELLALLVDELRAKDSHERPRGSRPM